MVVAAASRLVLKKILDRLGLQEAQGRNVWSVFIWICEAVATIILTAISNISPYSSLPSLFLIVCHRPEPSQLESKHRRWRKDDGKHYFALCH